MFTSIFTKRGKDLFSLEKPKKPINYEIASPQATNKTTQADLQEIVRKKNAGQKMPVHSNLFTGLK